MSARWTHCAPWQPGRSASTCCSTNWRDRGHDPRLDSHVDALRPALGDLETIQYRAREVAEDISLALQGSLLVRHGHPAVAEAFLATGWAVRGAAHRNHAHRTGSRADLERALVKG